LLSADAAAGVEAAGVDGPCLQAVMLPAIKTASVSFVKMGAFFIMQFLLLSNGFTGDYVPVVPFNFLNKSLQR
jgi:hypothetical protein